MSVYFKVPMPKLEQKTRLQIALEVRDHLLPLIRANAKFEDASYNGENYKILAWDFHNWKFAFLSPFNMPKSDHALPTPDYGHALLKQQSCPNLPYRLDVWHGQKVMSLEWSNSQAKLISFRPGEWSQQVLWLTEAPETEDPPRGGASVNSQASC